MPVDDVSLNVMKLKEWYDMLQAAKSACENAFTSLDTVKTPAKGCVGTELAPRRREEYRSYLERLKSHLDKRPDFEFRSQPGEKSYLWYQMMEMLAEDAQHKDGLIGRMILTGSAEEAKYANELAEAILDLADSTEWLVVRWNVWVDAPGVSTTGLATRTPTASDPYSQLLQALNQSESEGFRLAQENREQDDLVHAALGGRSLLFAFTPNEVEYASGPSRQHLPDVLKLRMDPETSTLGAKSASDSSIVKQKLELDFEAIRYSKLILTARAQGKVKESSVNLGGEWTAVRQEIQTFFDSEEGRILDPSILTASKRSCASQLRKLSDVSSWTDVPEKSETSGALVTVSRVLKAIEADCIDYSL